MNDYVVLSEKMYDKAKIGASLTGNEVLIIGEQTVLYDGVEIEQYIYHIVGYTAENGKPFVARKCNIMVFE